MELLYLAGLWDADGSFGITRREVKIWEIFQPFTGITLCSPKSTVIFDRLVKKYGGTVFQPKRKDWNEKWKLPFKWFLNSQSACEFALELSPYLLIKKTQAEMLAAWPRKYNWMTKKQRKTTHGQQKELWKKMVILNKRGR